MRLLVVDNLLIKKNPNQDIDETKLDELKRVEDFQSYKEILQ